MSADLTPVYYVTGTLASMAVVLGGARSYFYRQRERWTKEGASAARQSEALEANTKAASQNSAAITENTTAIGTMTRKLDKFADETRRELNEHDNRIWRLEDIVGEGAKQSRRPRPPGHQEGAS